MYGKIFGSMYDGTLYGHWQAIVTFQQMIVLADADGIVDMTPQAMAARTSIPLEIIQAGIPVLEASDPYSRTPDEDGKRIELIDGHRPWGWHIINHEKYKNLKDADEVRAQNRDRQQRFRDKKNGVTKGNVVSQPVTPRNARSRHTDTDTDTDTKDQKPMSGKPDVSPPFKEKANGNPAYKQQAREVLAFLNRKTGRDYQPVDANLDLIVARLKEGASEQDLRSVVAKKCRDWKGDEKMDTFLRPKTLFSKTNYAQYRGELIPEAPDVH